jgi:hypothetical protein
MIDAPQSTGLPPVLERKSQTASRLIGDADVGQKSRTRAKPLAQSGWR